MSGGAGKGPGGLLYWFAGADRSLLGQLRIERAWYQALGLSVVLTALASSVSMTFALSLSLGGSWLRYLPFSVIWGLFVFNVDRWLVSTVSYGPLDETNDGREPRTVGRYVGYVVRFAFAGVLAIVISEPIVLQIFHREVDEQVAVAKTAASARAEKEILARPEFAGEQQRIDGSVAAADTELSAAQAVLAAANKALDDEISGAGGTGVPGCGRRCAERRQAVRAATDRLARAQTAQRETHEQAKKDKTALDIRVRAAIAERTAKISGGDGLLAREQALTQLMSDHPDLRARRWFVSVLFLLIDLIPLLLKTFGPTTMHDRNVRFAAVAHAQLYGLKEHLHEAGQHAKVGREKLTLKTERSLERTRSTHILSSTRHRHRHERRLRELEIEHAHHRADLDAKWKLIAGGTEALPDGWGLPPVPATAQTRAPAAPQTPAVPQTPAATRVDDEPAPGPGTPPIVSGSVRQIVVGGRWVLGPPLLSAERGGFGDPYLAYDRSTPGAEAVLKRIRMMPYSDERAIQRALRYLRKEQRLQSTVESPFVAPVLDAGDDADFGPYLATPHYSFGTVWRRIHAPDFVATLEWALRICEQILAGLVDCAYQAALVHLDIKPSNVALSDDGDVKLIDFGLARSLGQPGTTSSLAPVFSRWYAPPEQIVRADNWQSSHADVRAVGATLYEILTGRPPLYREAEALGIVGHDERNFAALIALICDPSVRPIRVDTLIPRVPASVADLLDQWLDHDPERRVTGRKDFAVCYAAEALAAVQQQVQDAGLDELAVGLSHVVEPPPAPPRATSSLPVQRLRKPWAEATGETLSGEPIWSRTGRHEHVDEGTAE